MADERKPQDEPTKVAKATKELSKEELDQVAGGAEFLVITSVNNVLITRHDTAKNSISNVR